MSRQNIAVGSSKLDSGQRSPLEEVKKITEETEIKKVSIIQNVVTKIRNVI